MDPELFECPEPGAVFDRQTGRLYFHSPARREVFTPWPRPSAWRKIEGKRSWEPFQPDIWLSPGELLGNVLPSNDEPLLPGLKEAISERNELLIAKSVAATPREWWFARIPVQIRDVLSRFPHGHWELLQFVSRFGKAALELLQSNPALGFCLVYYTEFRGKTERKPSVPQLREMLRQPQHTIMEWLGFLPASQASRKILAKIPPDLLDLNDLKALRHALPCPEVTERLSHLRRINPESLRIVLDREIAHLAAPALLREISEDDEHGCVRGLLHSIAKWRHDEGVAQKNTQPVRNATKEWDECFEASLSRKPTLDAVFQPPPYEGTDSIVPIRTIFELYDEGKKQKHCIFYSFLDGSLAGTAYVYRLYRPERATIALERYENEWEVVDIRGKCNKTVSPKANKVVDTWLAGAKAKVNKAIRLNELPITEFHGGRSRDLV